MLEHAGDYPALVAAGCGALLRQAQLATGSKSGLRAAVKLIPLLKSERR
ncbi:hypothetical protein KCP71_03660 [Salmonella enterica subsp. enterica]|nr:hypothetical protein KCP71_03660 [Salmonella enterica subsp. enterica]